MVIHPPPPRIRHCMKVQLIRALPENQLLHYLSFLEQVSSGPVVFIVVIVAEPRQKSTIAEKWDGWLTQAVYCFVTPFKKVTKPFPLWNEHLVFRHTMEVALHGHTK